MGVGSPSDDMSYFFFCFHYNIWLIVLPFEGRATDTHFLRFIFSYPALKVNFLTKLSHTRNPFASRKRGNKGDVTHDFEMSGGPLLFKSKTLVILYYK